MAHVFVRTPCKYRILYIRTLKADLTSIVSSRVCTLMPRKEVRFCAQRSTIRICALDSLPGNTFLSCPPDLAKEQWASSACVRLKKRHGCSELLFVVAYEVGSQWNRTRDRVCAEWLHVSWRIWRLVSSPKAEVYS